MTRSNHEVLLFAIFCAFERYAESMKLLKYVKVLPSNCPTTSKALSSMSSLARFLRAASWTITQTAAVLLVPKTCPIWPSQINFKLHVSTYLIKYSCKLVFDWQVSSSRTIWDPRHTFFPFTRWFVQPLLEPFLEFYDRFIPAYYFLALSNKLLCLAWPLPLPRLWMGFFLKASAFVGILSA